MLVMRNASNNIGFELVISCSRWPVPAAGCRLVFGIMIFIFFLPFHSPRHLKPRSLSNIADVSAPRSSKKPALCKSSDLITMLSACRP